MEFITSNKGSLKLLYQGFSYVKQKDLVDNVVSYECVRRRSANGKCIARIYIRDDEIVGEVGDHSHHTHQPNPAGTETLKVVAAMKHRVRTTQETPQQIIADSVTRLHPAAAPQLPTMHNIRRNIRLHRPAAEHPLPVSLDVLLMSRDTTGTPYNQGGKLYYTISIIHCYGLLSFFLYIINMDC